MINKNKSLIIGIDDATKCPCIGSIFVSGVLADQATIKYWKDIGIKDSKLLSSSKRNQLAKIIKDTSISYSIQEITPEQMNDNFFNLNDWEMLTVLQIIDSISKNIEPLIIYIDNWEVSNIKFFERLDYLLNQLAQVELTKRGLGFDRSRLAKFNYYPQHKADELYVVVGAASILSKTSSDAQFNEYRRVYGDFGSGSPADPKTRMFVWKHRREPLPIIRTTWTTYKNISKLKKIEDDIIIRRIKKYKL